MTRVNFCCSTFSRRTIWLHFFLGTKTQKVTLNSANKARRSLVFVLCWRERHLFRGGKKSFLSSCNLLLLSHFLFPLLPQHVFAWSSKKCLPFPSSSLSLCLSLSLSLSLFLSRSFEEAARWWDGDGVCSDRKKKEGCQGREKEKKERDRSKPKRRIRQLLFRPILRFESTPDCRFN